MCFARNSPVSAEWYRSSISDYGMIGNCRTAALVSKAGSVDWCCLPFFSSDGVFSALLGGPAGGYYSVAPAVPFTSRQYYLDQTNILVTEFVTDSGRARLTDCFTVTSSIEQRKRFWPDTELLRCLDGIEGEVPMRLQFCPRSRFGKKGMRFRSIGAFGFSNRENCPLLFFRTSLDPEKIRAGADGEGLASDFTVRADQRIYFSMVYDDQAPAVVPPLGEWAAARIEETERYWRSWIEQCQYTGPFQEHVYRSALALKLMIFAPSGAVVAAPTTSLPETLGGERNWDYRFSWIRDAALTMDSLVGLGFLLEANAFADWLMHTTRSTRPELQVVYSLFGHTALREKELDWLEGYAGSKPVRVGNEAADQFQLDVYGELIQAIGKLAPALERFDRETQRFLLGLGKHVMHVWELPDEGIWEVREGTTHHTHSKVMAWTALNELCKLERFFEHKKLFPEFRDAAGRIRSAIERHGFNPALGAYTRGFNDDALDASCLVFPMAGYCDASSPRMQSTVRAIEKGLGHGPFVYRYRFDDGLEGKEGAFGACTFWMVEVLALSGRVEEAVERFERIMAYRNEVGLWSEEIDPESGTFLGNYPQAFTHVGLIDAALAINEALRRREEGKVA